MLPPITKNPTAHQALNYIMQSATPSPTRSRKTLEQLANIIREELDSSEPKAKFINVDGDVTLAEFWRPNNDLPSESTALPKSEKPSDDEVYGLKSTLSGFDIFTNTNFNKYN
tara:strand:- start:2 stop:340 length:339 start_codon:yes stop_codon:yes gene_type:complete